MPTTTPGTAVPVDPCSVLALAASVLSEQGPQGVGRVLDAVVASLDLRSAVLRDAARGDVWTLAGEIVHAVPPRRSGAGPEAGVQLPVHGGGARIATLTVVGARPSQLPVLRAVCAVLGLALTPPAPPAALPLALLAAADADADATADDLHDGPVQELVFARFAADAAVRGGDAVTTRDAMQAALQSLRRALWLLRPRGAGDGGLSAALGQLSDRLVETGRPPLELDLDPGACAALGPQAASVCYRLVQAMARAGDEPVEVALRRTATAVVLDVAADGPLPAPDRWRARAGALGAVLSADPTGRVALSVPPAPGTDPPSEIEAT